MTPIGHLGSTSRDRAERGSARKRSWHALYALPIAIAAVLGACRESLPTKFPHEVHLRGRACGGPGEPECPTCTSCHAVRESDKHALPSPKVCLACHGPSAGAAANSAAAHSAVSRIANGREATGSRGTVSFSHKQHLGMEAIRGQCVDCHAGVVQAGQPEHPSMARCLVCHQAEFDRGACTPCHLERALARLVPQTFMRHTPAWIRGHGVAATQRRAICLQCHTEASCNECHDTNQPLRAEVRNPDDIVSSFVHRGDFVTRHAMESRSQPGSCLRCHTSSSCDACHVRSGVSAWAKDARSPHPRGWIGPDAEGRDSHGRAARRDIIECASCHDQGPATNCIRCHRVGGTGGNPHPQGWQSARSTAASMCRYCHEP